MTFLSVQNPPVASITIKHKAKQRPMQSTHIPHLLSDSLSHYSPLFTPCQPHFVPHHSQTAPGTCPPRRVATCTPWGICTCSFPQLNAPSTSITAPRCSSQESINSLFIFYLSILLISFRMPIMIRDSFLGFLPFLCLCLGFAPL